MSIYKKKIPHEFLELDLLLSNYYIEPWSLQLSYQFSISFIKLQKESVFKWANAFERSHLTFASKSHFAAVN